MYIQPRTEKPEYIKNQLYLFSSCQTASIIRRGALFICYVKPIVCLRILLEKELYGMVSSSEILCLPKRQYKVRLFISIEYQNIFEKRLQQMGFVIMQMQGTSEVQVIEFQRYFQELCLIDNPLSIAQFVADDDNFNYMKVHKNFQLLVIQGKKMFEAQGYQVQHITSYIELDDQQNGYESIQGLLPLLFYYIQVDLFQEIGNKQKRYYIHAQKLGPIIILHRCLGLDIHGSFITKDQFDKVTQQLNRYELQNKQSTHNDLNQDQPLKLPQHNELINHYPLILSSQGRKEKKIRGKQKQKISKNKTMKEVDQQFQSDQSDDQEMDKPDRKALEKLYTLHIPKGGQPKKV